MLVTAFASPVLPRYNTFRMPAPFGEYEPIPRWNDNSRDQDISNVMPLAIKTIKFFLKGMTPRERAHYDLDDVTQEVWELLCDKYSSWDPGRSKFTTFSRDLIRKHLSELRNHCRVVDAPRDAAYRLRNPEKQRKSTLLATQQATHDTTSLNKDDLLYSQEFGDGIDEVVEKSEISHLTREIMDTVYKILTCQEIIVISLAYGMEGSPKLAMRQIAAKLKISSRDAEILKEDAEAKLRKHFESKAVAYSSGDD